MRNRHQELGVRIRVKFEDGFDPKKLSNDELNHLNSYLCEILQDTLLIAAFEDSKEGNEE